MGEMIELKAADGAKIGAYKAMPPGEAKGGIVVVQEVFGVNHHIRAVTDRVAAAGYVALAPAIFDRAEKGVELAYDDSGMSRGVAFGAEDPYGSAFSVYRGRDRGSRAGGADRDHRVLPRRHPCLRGRRHAANFYPRRLDIMAA